MSASLKESLDAVTVSDLVKTYRGPRKGSVRALSGVSLSVPKGSIFGLIGPNGAGKTTLVKCLLGLVRSTQGTCRIFGVDSKKPRSRLKVGYLPENPMPPGYLTPIKGLVQAAALAKAPDAGNKESIARLLEMVDLSEVAGRKIGTFSKGMRQRYGLACALINQPDLLILDEPTDGVDPVGRAAIRDILLAQRKRGATIFINSHLLAETERVCDAVAILSEGKVARSGSMAEVIGGASGFTVRLEAAKDAGPLPSKLAEAQGDDGLIRLSGLDLAAFNQLLDQARQAGYLVAGVVPMQRDLEQVLLSVVSKR